MLYKQNGSTNGLTNILLQAVRRRTTVRFCTVPVRFCTGPYAYKGVLRPRASLFLLLLSCWASAAVSGSRDEERGRERERENSSSTNYNSTSNRHMISCTCVQSYMLRVEKSIRDMNWQTNVHTYTHTHSHTHIYTHIPLSWSRLHWDW
jgi:hypothetical protein